MTPNLGTIDRIFRATLGIVLLYLIFFSGLPPFASPFLFYGTVFIAMVMLLTSIVKICPLYSLIGLKTCRAC